MCIANWGFDWQSRWWIGAVIFCQHYCNHKVQQLHIVGEAGRGRSLLGSGASSGAPKKSVAASLGGLVPGEVVYVRGKVQQLFLLCFPATTSYLQVLWGFDLSKLAPGSSTDSQLCTFVSRSPALCVLGLEISTVESHSRVELDSTQCWSNSSIATDRVNASNECPHWRWCRWYSKREAAAMGYGQLDEKLARTGGLSRRR